MELPVMATLPSLFPRGTRSPAPPRAGLLIFGVQSPSGCRRVRAVSQPAIGRMGRVGETSSRHLGSRPRPHPAAARAFVVPPHEGELCPQGPSPAAGPWKSHEHKKPRPPPGLLFAP